MSGTAKYQRIKKEMGLKPPFHRAAPDSRKKTYGTGSLEKGNEVTSIGYAFSEPSSGSLNISHVLHHWRMFPLRKISSQISRRYFIFGSFGHRISLLVIGSFPCLLMV
jgi:hypothetical protein